MPIVPLFMSDPTVTLPAIAEAIAQTLVDGGLVGSYSWVPDTIEPPAVLLELPTVNYSLTFGRNFHEMTLPLVAFTSRAVDKVGQHQLLDLMLGETSVKSILEADLSNPPGAAHGVTDLQVVEARPLSVQEVAGYQMYGGLFTCLLHVQES